MKHIKLFILPILLFFNSFTMIHAQKYLIDFTASGTTTSLDSVYVENIAQGTMMTLSGSDTLHLIGPSGVSNITDQENLLKIFPNPLYETAYLTFYSKGSTLAVVDIYNISGKHILHISQNLQAGNNLFKISGFPSGHYVLQVKTKKWHKTATFVSLNHTCQNPQMLYINLHSDKLLTETTRKRSKNVVSMSYTDGEELLFIGFSGLLSEIVNVVPASSKTMNFEFSPSSCGAIFTDARDGNEYPTVLIGSQCWMARNLAYLPSVIGPDSGSTTIPLYYVYGYYGSDINEAKITYMYNEYGALYNWPAIMAGSASSAANPSGVQGACPAGWHVPSDAEWKQLTDYLGGPSVAGAKLKQSGTLHWNSPNYGATNETGFTALPGGSRLQNIGAFSFLGQSGSWWSAKQSSAGFAWDHRIYSYNTSILRQSTNMEAGKSVRCVRDN